MKIEMTEAHYHEMNEGCEGVCLKCGNEQFGCEPDARRYECEACGEKAVYGVEEALMMGAVEFVDEDEED